MLDKAGEWLKDTPEFAAQCKTRSIRVINPPAKSDKRMMSRAEMAVQIIKRRTKAIKGG
jgi:biotin carboxylase